MSDSKKVGPIPFPKEVIQLITVQSENHPDSEVRLDPIDADNLVAFCEFANARIRELQQVATDQQVTLAMIARILKC